MRGSLYQGPLRSRLLDLIITSDSLALTKPHIYEYSWFILNPSSAANLFFAIKSSAPGIPSEY